MLAQLPRIQKAPGEPRAFLHQGSAEIEAATDAQVVRQGRNGRAVEIDTAADAQVLWQGRDCRAAGIEIAADLQVVRQQKLAVIVTFSFISRSTKNWSLLASQTRCRYQSYF